MFQNLLRQYDQRLSVLNDNHSKQLPSNLPAYLKPALRIFLSVDIVNSTAFKQAPRPAVDKKSRSREEIIQNDRPEEPWFSPIASFYRGIERRLAEEWENHSKSFEEIELIAGPAPSLWKASGDEVIYVKTLEIPSQALLSARAWMSTVNAHRKEIKKDFPSLDLKASAWLAGFPVNNAEVILHRKPRDGSLENEGDPLLENFARLKELYDKNENDDGDMFRDYIGPSMDTGFRVSSLATPRKFAITIDLAYMVADAALSIPKHLELGLLREPTFQYEGRVHLKGVSGGAPYPYFWIDMMEDDSLLKKEDGLMGRKPLKCDEVREFCTEFYSNRTERGPFMAPYILNEPSKSPFSSIPPHHLERLEGLAYWAQGLSSRQDEQKSLSESEGETGTDSNVKTNGVDAVLTFIDGLSKLMAKQNVKPQKPAK